MAQLFYRRHYETLQRILGAACYRARSPIARRTIDLIVGLFVRVLTADAPTFNEQLFRQGVRLHSHADDTKEG